MLSFMALHRLPAWMGLTLACGLLASWGEAAPPGETADSPRTGGVLFAVPREAQRRLSRARQAILDNRYGDAIAEVRLLLDEGAEDGFLASADGDATLTTVRREAGRLIDALPPEGRRSYQLRYGGDAQALLDQAVRRRDCQALARIGRTHLFYTKAGYQAALLLVQDHLDHGRPMEAIGWLRRLGESAGAAVECEPLCGLLTARCWLAAGQPERAREALDRIKRRAPGAKFRIGERSFDASSDMAAPLRLLAPRIDAPRGPLVGPGEQWTMFRGSPDRNAASSWGGGLGAVLWGLKTVERSADGDSIRVFFDPTVPALHPLVVGPTVLLRTPTHLWAVELESGRRIWEFPWRTPANGDQRGAGPRSRVDPTRSMLAQQRVWRDGTYGQLSSDGRRVFLLDPIDTLPAPGPQAAAIGVWSYGLREPPNRLVALDLQREGAIAWAVGGRSGEDEPRLAGAFFLGAPLVADERLYALAEIKGDIVLAALDLASGRLEWSQAIARPQETIFQDRVRRIAGATPSFADGVLVCPTSAGAVVAVDPATRSLVWGYQYPRVESFARRRVGGRVISTPTNAGQRPGWADATATMAEGRVVLCPGDSEFLCCLDLAGGEEVWSCRCNDSVLVACIHEGKVLLVGRHEVTALRLADREPAWEPRSVPLPEGASPSGRGLYCGRYYWLPTTARQLLQIDLDDGRIASLAKTEKALGNLVGLKDRVVSQSPESVEAFGLTR
jgi:outer membrane protein assembly factor BamB